MKSKNFFIEAWLKKYPDLKLVRDIKSGKEASLVLVEIDNQLRCIKTYNRLSMAAKVNNIYLSGKWFRQSSVRKAVKSGNNFSKDLLKKLWIKREFYLLKKLHQRGANVPQVFDFNQDSIIMEYLGDKNISAPQIKDIKFNSTSSQKVFEIIKENIKIFLKCGIVHSDLSEFNILWWQDKPYIIDFPQAVDIRTNPNYRDLLKRDIDNINRFFSKFNL